MPILKQGSGIRARKRNYHFQQSNASSEEPGVADTSWQSLRAKEASL